MPSTTVRPAAVIVMAMPITTWSPGWLTQAKPCSIDSARPTATAAVMASANEPLAAPTLAAANAVASILPSRPRSMTPARSDKVLASAHRISGVATRKRRCDQRADEHFIHSRPPHRPAAGTRDATRARRSPATGAAT